MSKKRRAIWTIDCETDPFKSGRIPEPFLWGLYDGENEKYYEFETVAETVAFIEKKEIILYAHNGGKFDYHYLRNHINSDENIMVIAGRIAKAKIGLCELRDSLNLFPQTKLADFSKLEIDYKKMEKSERIKPEVRAEISKYLRWDCESLWKLVNEFMKRYGLNLTQAGSSMRYWEKNYEKPAPKSSPEYYEKFAPFFYGGRVQCFAEGNKKENFNVIDINSAYPYAMLENHPYSTQYTLTKKLPKDGEIAQSLIELDAIVKGCFPLRGENGLYFPDDNKIRRYFVSGWELLAGFETNSVQIVDVKNVYNFLQQETFKDYVMHFYEERKQAKLKDDKASNIFAKLFMNSLYGKFASNPTKYREYVLATGESVNDWFSKGYQPCGQWAGREMMQRPLPHENRRYYNVATAASITGFVRAYLWKALNKCSGVLYCDTDSIAARDVSQIALGNELGQWKLECEADEYAIAGKKLYAFHKKGEPRLLEGERKVIDKHWKVACKGVDLNPGQIIRIANGETLTHANQVPNYSIHKPDIAFIDRIVKRTYKDISKYEDSDNDSMAAI